jgi:hypothetical protein
MASALGMMGQAKIEGTVSMEYIAMVAQVVGEITKDEQLLQIAAALQGGMNGAQ